FVGVAAPTEQMARKAIEAIKAEWKPTSEASSSTDELTKQLKKPRRGKGGGKGFGKGGAQRRGAVGAGVEGAGEELGAAETTPCSAHAPLEPRAAVAEWNDGKLTVWTGTQMPFRVRSELARTFELEESDVRVIVPDTGSGYGGKHTGEAAVEAARLAKAAGK